MANDIKARVTVSTSSGRVDLSLPIYETVGDTIADLVPYLRSEFKAADKDTRDLEDKTASWTLVQGLNDVLPANKTLDELGIQTGMSLRLEKTSAKETYPALIDDVPDSIAAFQKQKFPAWDNVAAQRLSAYIAPIVSLVISITLMYMAGTGAVTSWFVRAPLAGFLLILASGGLAAAYMTTHKRRDTLDPVRKLGVPSAGVGFSFLMAAAFVILPSTLSLWHVVSVSATVFVVSLGLKFFTSGIESVNYVVLTASGIYAIGSGLSLWLGLTPSQFAAISGALALSFLIIISSRLSMSLADIPMPYVPTMGESHVNPMEEDITKLPTSASTRAIESIVNRERQIVDAHAALVGLSIGGVLAIGISVMTIAATMDTKPWILFAFVMTVVLAMVFRGKSYDDYMIQQIWLIGVVTVMSTYLVVLVFVGKAGELVIPSVVLFAVGTAVAVFTAVKNQRINSPVIMRMFELIEVVINAAPLVWIALLLDIYGQFRYR